MPTSTFFVSMQLTQDYMDDVHGKEINLMKTTVKIPGQKPRGSQNVRTNPTSGPANGLASDLHQLSIGKT